MDTLGISFGEKDAEYVAKSFCQNAEGRVVLNRYLVQFFRSQFWPILYTIALLQLYFHYFLKYY